MIETDILLFLRHPIRKLLAAINQSPYLICFCYNFFDIAKETNTYEKNRGYFFRRSDIALFYFSSHIFLKNQVLIEKGNPSEKNVIVEEELDGTDIDDIGNFHLDLCSLIKHVGISKYSMMMENLLEILAKRRSQRGFTIA